MQVKEHSNWSHGLRPGTTHDMNCTACKAEEAKRRDLEDAWPTENGRNVGL